METFRYRLTGIALENGRQTSVIVVAFTITNLSDLNIFRFIFVKHYLS